MTVITFLSDFGYQDSYAGSVKGVILSLNADAVVVDISHNMRPFHIGNAAYHISCYYSQYPGGTIHLAVVDPGVGGSREALILKTEKYFFVGPDNGLFSHILKYNKTDCYRIDELKMAQLGVDISNNSNTFHARDIFAPAAACLSKGISIKEITTGYISDPIIIGNAPELYDNYILAGILSIDNFGNIITNLNINDLRSIHKRGIAEIHYKEYIFNQTSKIYEEVPIGTPLVLWGSSGYMEIALNQGNAADFFKSDEKSDKIRINLV